MAIVLASKPGLTGANTLSIPKDWDPTWFRGLVNNVLKGGDVRNAVGKNGITVTGNIASPYATISFGAGPIVITGSGSSIATAPLTIVSTFSPGPYSIVFSDGTNTQSFIGFSGDGTHSLQMGTTGAFASQILTSDMIRGQWNAGGGLQISNAGNGITELLVNGGANTNIVEFTDGTVTLAYQSSNAPTAFWGTLSNHSLSWMTNNVNRGGIGATGTYTMSDPNVAATPTLQVSNSKSTCIQLTIASNAQDFIQFSDGTLIDAFISAGATQHLQISGGASHGVELDSSGIATLTCAAGNITISATNGVLIATTTALTNAAGAAAGTLTNAPTAGNPTKWIEINDNGTIRKIPTWT